MLPKIVTYGMDKRGVSKKNPEVFGKETADSTTKLYMLCYYKNLWIVPAVSKEAAMGKVWEEYLESQLECMKKKARDWWEQLHFNSYEDALESELQKIPRLKEDFFAYVYVYPITDICDYNVKLVKKEDGQ